MTLSILTVADAISNLSVSGVTIKDIDAIPQTLTDRDCPMLLPDPDNPVSDFELEPVAWGIGSGRPMDATYTLNYLLVQGQVGMGRTNKLEQIAAGMTSAVAVVNAVIAANGFSGAVDVIPKIGAASVVDMGGASFHVVELKFDVTEQVQ